MIRVRRYYTADHTSVCTQSQHGRHEWVQRHFSDETVIACRLCDWDGFRHVTEEDNDE